MPDPQGMRNGFTKKASAPVDDWELLRAGDWSTTVCKLSCTRLCSPSAQCIGAIAFANTCSAVVICSGAQHDHALPREGPR